MKHMKDIRFYKFLIPSLIGAFLFVLPVNQNGNLTIPIAIAANKLLELMGGHALTIIWLLISMLPPLSKIPETYNTEKPYCEDIPKGKTPAQYGMQLALKKAENAPGITEFFKEGIENVLEMWFGTLPVILGIGTIALIIAEYTPVFKILGIPFIPVSLVNLFVIFLERTIVTLPVVALLAHLIF